MLYDRRQKRLIQKKWCDLVSHIADETIPVNVIPRRVTIYLTAPPGDSVRTTRDHFREYIKPVLVAAALDWDVVEGRREGDVRAGLAERVRKLRKRRGEATEKPLEEDAETVVQNIRDSVGIREWEGVQGDIVIGRNAWKEYVRGLHEGWLGPLDPPPDPVTNTPSTTASSETPQPEVDQSSPTPDSAAPSQRPSIGVTATPSSSPTTEPPASPPPAEEPKPTKPRVPPPYIPASTTAYASASLPPSLPSELGPSTTIPLPHILGFRNTPIRIYRFLTRRHLADDVGRQTAAVVLATYRPFQHSSSASPLRDVPGDTDSSSSATTDDTSPDSSTASRQWEQQTLLQHEEREWLKSVRERKEGEGERVWIDDMVLDPRIAERMRRFELAGEKEERMQRILEGREGLIRRSSEDGEKVE